MADNLNRQMTPSTAPLSHFAPYIALLLTGCTQLRRRLDLARHQYASAEIMAVGLTLAQLLADAQVVSPKPEPVLP